MVLVMVADPKAATEVFGKYKTWQRPKLLYRVFELFGPNVASVNGEDWQRHRKVAAKGFTEQNYDLVWRSATKQAGQMMDTMPPHLTLQQLNTRISTLTMHVLSYAGFGHDYEFDRGVKEVPSGHTKSFADAMSHFLLNIIFAFLLSTVPVAERWMPAGWREIKASERELWKYFNENLQSEGTGDLVAAIVEANAEAKKETTKSDLDSKSRSYLTEDEMYGNLFLLQLAGFETTSSVLQLALARLGAMPELQDWIVQDIDHSSDTEIDATDDTIGSYTDAFPRQTRCLAFMYEVLRYYGTTPELVRYSSQDEALVCGDRTIPIPAGVYVAANVPALHYNPTFWGDDITEFKPSRWIEHDPSPSPSTPQSSATQRESLKSAPPETLFIPWTTGPRVCPGKKFSQVEFVATTLQILRRYRIRASENMIEILADYDFRVGLYPREPQKAWVEFTERKPKLDG